MTRIRVLRYSFPIRGYPSDITNDQVLVEIDGEGWYMLDDDLWSIYQHDFSTVREAIDAAISAGDAEPADICDECTTPHRVSHVCWQCDFADQEASLEEKGYSRRDAKVEAILGGA